MSVFHSINLFEKLYFDMDTFWVLVKSSVGYIELN